jgi:FtsP/CotA-like multicopper oxidase with cupredoxin domain
LYWYHPHVREDYTQEMGLYGNILVTPAEPDYWPPADQDVVLTLDDVLVEDGRIAPFSPSETTHAAMGRFGNVLLIGGDVQPALTANAGDVVRLWLTNTANARVFNLALPGARMKLIGGDSGRMEHAQIVTEVLLGPSERAVVDVLLGQPGQLTLEHRTPRRAYHLAALTVTESPAARSPAREFDVLGQAPELIAEREGLDVWLNAPPDKVLSIVAEMDVSEGPEASGPVIYGCPMHPEITSEQPGRCPKCGMKLMAVQPGHAAEHQMGHEEGAAHHVGIVDDRVSTGGIEWEDDMADVNRRTTPANTRWQFRDPAGRDNGGEVEWKFAVGDRVKIRLQNEMASDHPMHHTFHLHGAGRFLVLDRDGVTEPNLVWKDTVLLRTGETVDILFDVTNAGRWMAHCHIPEHMHSGMMFTFTVDP